jgi:hypothetical protein
MPTVCNSMAMHSSGRNVGGIGTGNDVEKIDV